MALLSPLEIISLQLIGSKKKNVLYLFDNKNINILLIIVCHNKTICNYNLQCYFRDLIGIGYLVLQTNNILKAFLMSGPFSPVLGKFLTITTDSFYLVL